MTSLTTSTKYASKTGVPKRLLIDRLQHFVLIEHWTCLKSRDDALVRISGADIVLLMVPLKHKRCSHRVGSHFFARI